MGLKDRFLSVSSLVRDIALFLSFPYFYSCPF